MRLFSYCIPVDDGAAPNPFGGICTLAICKPVIRRVADVGCWVVGTGSSNVNGIDYSGKIIYAMRVSEKVTMEKYDQLCLTKYPFKIPKWSSNIRSEKLGDSVYDFQKKINGKPSVRPSVHTKENRDHDLGGENVLISDFFYYFGKEAIEIPDEYRIIARQGQGHQSNKNEEVKEKFIQWLTTSNFKSNDLVGYPQLFDEHLPENGKCSCGSYRAGESVCDEFYSGIVL